MEDNNFSRRISILTVFVLFLNFFFLKTVGYFGLAALFVTAFLALIVGFLSPNKFKKNSTQLTALTIMVALFSLILVTRANRTVTNLITVLGLNLLLLTHYTLVGGRLVRSSAELILVSGRTFIEYLKTLAWIFSGGLTKPSPETNSQVIFPAKSFKKVPLISVVVGLIISVPILAVLLGLLSRGDPIFGKAVQDILNSPLIKELIPRGLLTLTFFAGLLPFLFIKHADSFKNPVAKLQRFNFIHEYSTVMTLVALVLGAFLIVQWQYIFIPPVTGIDLSQFGFSTYSEYVNRGFDELLLAAFVIYTLVWTGLIILRSPHATSKKLLKILQLVVLSEFTVFVFSVFRRIYLYQHYHGLTLIRAYGGFFLALLLIYTAILFARHFWVKRWVLVDVLATVVIAIIFGLFNVENTIALYHPPTVNGRVDFTYLARLSADGYEGWVSSYKQVKSLLNNPTFNNKANYSFATPPGESRSDAPFSDEDRHVIAYSGVALEKLMENYNELIYKYGAENELKDYLTRMLEYSIRRVEISLSSPIFTRTTNIDTAEFTAERNRHKQELANLKTSMSEFLEDIKQGKTLPNQVRLTFYSPVQNIYMASERKVNFKQDICAYYNICTSNSNSSYWPSSPPHGFYSIAYRENSERKSWLDRLLIWNSSETEAYRKIKSGMPIDELLQLQEKYFDYFRAVAILASNGSEYNYNADINLNVPFLKPL
ncbi:hypothetical protein A2125_02190 [Candidatus Woesebacteria bacterium GWB1_43_5]|uniref:Uncharacterized protein n=1 Tax=Candidatus Woesebacteria bacterium GWB1_43_5 TaxID=1802474 RepID=A0A1F7WTM9_9BACT|nr:MAG: hypothetical protein A2125_02190 [Candidatus Woesebacteria bacterium GWB1_43_5]